MTTRADLPRLAGSLGVLGTVLEANGQTAWDTMTGWEDGPRKAPVAGERGGGLPEGSSEAEDRKDEAAQRRRAAKHHREFRADLDELDALVQRLLRKVDVACPPNPAELKNRATGDFEQPWTPAEVELADYCSSCWRHEQTFTRIYVDPRGMRRWKGSCSWCGPIRSQYKIDPPLELVAKHLAGRNISQAEFDEVMGRALAAAAPKPKRKGKRRKKAA